MHNTIFYTKKTYIPGGPIEFLYMQILKMLSNYKPFSTQEFFNTRGIYQTIKVHIIF